MSITLSENTLFNQTGHRIPGQKCGCTGNRSCFLCKLPDHLAAQPNYKPIKLYFCSQCGNQAFEVLTDHQQHQTNQNLGKQIKIDGIYVFPEAIDESTERMLIEDADHRPWVVSQSGRRKQDFGPKVNFKRQKVKMDDFKGLPKVSMDVLQAIRNRDAPSDLVLQDFDVVEVCNLEYCPERGSSIVPHLDDVWIWGDRLVTINLGSDTEIILTQNPDQVPADQLHANVEIVIQMPRRSLFVLRGEARYQWLHEIRRESIKNRRIAITFRELSNDFKQGGCAFDTIGYPLIQAASNRV